MKYLFILISFLSFIQFSLAAEKTYTLQSGDASLSVVKDGKRLILQTGNAHYLSLNAPYVVTLEVNAETLNGYYSSVKEEKKDSGEKDQKKGYPANKQQRRFHVS